MPSCVRCRARLPGLRELRGHVHANSMNCWVRSSVWRCPGNEPFRRSAGGQGGAHHELNPRRVEISKKAAHALKRCLEKMSGRSISSPSRLWSTHLWSICHGRLDQHNLHTLALAHSAGIPFNLDRLNEISAATPNICKVSPSRPEVHLEDVHRGGRMAAYLERIDRHAHSGLNLDVPPSRPVVDFCVRRTRRRWGRRPLRGKRIFEDRRAGVLSATWRRKARL